MSIEALNARSQGTLPGHLGIVITAQRPGEIEAELPIVPYLMAPNGYLHAGSILTLADTAAGFGCMSNLPEGAQSFTTLEIKSNHLATAREGVLRCTATLVHGGRSTQLWDAKVTHAGTGKTLALFRCTQMVLYPRG
ncbi:PaaI family thioesterase [Roseateles sp. DB2]|uniref:PaaI family thioesterase n=1 Tax=Roseateles sp. DB2 TaxID=3453717 RepID=UPI003EEB9694